MKTRAQLRGLLRTLRAQAAHDYSNRPETRRVYRDGYTEGWAARDAIAVDDARAGEDWDDSAGRRMLH